MLARLSRLALLLLLPFTSVAGAEVVLCNKSFPSGQAKVTVKRGSCAPGSQLPDLSDFTAILLLSAPEAVFTGTLPQSLSSLTRLSTLDLSNNQLTGTIPDLSLLTGLRALYLQENELSGEIAAILPSSLRWLNLFDNGISGALPKLIDFPQLITFVVAGNQLTGTIPEVSSLPSLDVLNLGDNQLTGTAPLLPEKLLIIVVSDNQLSGTIPALHANTKLTRIAASQATFSGTIPDAISSLIKLEYINLSNNQLTGTIPDLSLLTDLRTLALQENELSGEIVGLFPPSIAWLSVATNQLTGSLPRFTDLPLLDFFGAKNNQLSGTIPQFSSLPVLQRMILAENELIGSMPALPDNGVFWRFTVNNNQLTGTLPSLTEYSQLRQVALHNNFFHGDVPELPVTIETAVFQNSHLDGTIPNLSTLTSLEHFDASHNSLTGAVPNVASTSLRVFDVAYNQLSGPFPSFPQAIQLERVALAENSWLCPVSDYDSLAPTTDHALMSGYCDLLFTVSSSDILDVGAQNVLELGIFSESQLDADTQFEYGPFGNAEFSGCTSSSPTTLHITSLPDGKSGVSAVLLGNVPEETWFLVTCGYSLPESPIQPPPQVILYNLDISAVVVSDPDVFLLSLLPPCDHAAPEAVSLIAAEVTKAQALLVQWSHPALACDNAQSFEVFSKRVWDEWGEMDEVTVTSTWEAQQLVDYLHVHQSPLDYIPPTTALLQGFATRYWYTFAVVPANQEKSQAEVVWSCPVWLAESEPLTPATCLQPIIAVDANRIPSLSPTPDPPSTRTQRWAFPESETIFRHYSALRDRQQASTNVVLFEDNYHAILTELQEECSGCAVSLVFEPIDHTHCTPMFIFTSDDREVRKVTATMRGHTSIKETGAVARTITLGWCPSLPFFTVLRAMREWQSGSTFRVPDSSVVRELLEPTTWQIACWDYFGDLSQDQTLCSVDTSNAQQPLYRMLHEEEYVAVRFLPVVSSVSHASHASALTFSDSTGSIDPAYGWHAIYAANAVSQCSKSSTARLFGDNAVWYPCVEASGQWFVLEEPTVTTHTVPDAVVDVHSFGNNAELMEMAVLSGDQSRLLYRSVFDSTKQHAVWSFSRLFSAEENHQRYSWKAFHTPSDSWDSATAAVSDQLISHLSSSVDFGQHARHAFTCYNQAPQHHAMKEYYWSQLERRVRVLRKTTGEVYTLTGALGAMDSILGISLPGFLVKAVCVQHIDGTFSSHAYVMSNTHSACGDWSAMQPAWERELTECYSLATLGDTFPSFVQQHMTPKGQQVYQARYPTIPLQHSLFALAFEQFAGTPNSDPALVGVLPEECITAPFVQPEGCVDVVV